MLDTFTLPLAQRFGYASFRMTAGPSCNNPIHISAVLAVTRYFDFELSARSQLPSKPSETSRTPFYLQAISITSPNGPIAKLSLTTIMASPSQPPVEDRDIARCGEVSDEQFGNLSNEKTHDKKHPDGHRDMGLRISTRRFRFGSSFRPKS